MPPQAARFAHSTNTFSCKSPTFVPKSKARPQRSASASLPRYRWSGTLSTSDALGPMALEEPDGSALAQFPAQSPQLAVPSQVQEIIRSLITSNRRRLPAEAGIHGRTLPRHRRALLGTLCGVASSDHGLPADLGSPAGRMPVSRSCRVSLAPAGWCLLDVHHHRTAVLLCQPCLSGQSLDSTPEMASDLRKCPPRKFLDDGSKGLVWGPSVSLH